MESIRSMVATLDNAFADRRVYIVKSIFLYAEENSAANLFEAGTPKDGEENKNMNLMLIRLRMKSVIQLKLWDISVDFCSCYLWSLVGLLNGLRLIIGTYAMQY